MRELDVDDLNLTAILNNIDKFMGKNPEKPPIGLRPEYIWKMQCKVDRLQEISNAMARYESVNITVPEEWKDELRKLLHS